MARGGDEWFFPYVLKDEALVLHPQLMPGLVSWHRSADHELLPDEEAKSIPTSRSEVQLTFGSTKLSSRSADHKLLADDKAKSISTSWSEVKLAFESTYLSISFTSWSEVKLTVEST